MKVIRTRNVADALPAGLAYLLVAGERADSRAGPVLVAPEPVTTVYLQPTERVLHSAIRDANPFFHLVEALWMLAGRQDAALLSEFVGDFGERFAERDGTIHGAYGHRWRRALGVDQLAVAVGKLRKDWGDRQAVIQMWDASVPHGDTLDEGSGCDDLDGVWRDRPCNTHAYLRVRQEPTLHLSLDVTVCCRSNDAVWGAYGANAVHFSVLQEYLAAAIGVGVGRYYQVSNNFHVYEAEIERLLARAGGARQELPAHLVDQRYCDRYVAPYASVGVRPAPLVTEPEHFLDDVRLLLEAYEQQHSSISLENRFLSSTVWPALMGHRAWRQGRREESAMLWLDAIEADDWRGACTEWVGRRAARRAAKQTEAAE